MKKSMLLLSLIVLLFASCVTQKKCNEKFPPQVSTIIKDSISIKDSIVYSYIEVPVYIKGDTVEKEVPVYINVKTGLSNSKPVYAETSFAKAKAQVVNGKLELELIQKDSLFKVKTDSLIKQSWYWQVKYKYENTKAVQLVKVVPKYYQIMSIVGIVAVGFIIAYLLFMLRDKFRIR